MDPPLLGFSIVRIYILVYSLQISILSVFNSITGIFYIPYYFVSNCL